MTKAEPPGTSDPEASKTSEAAEERSGDAEAPVEAAKQGESPEKPADAFALRMKTVTAAPKASALPKPPRSGLAIAPPTSAPLSPLSKLGTRERTVRTPTGAMPPLAAAAPPAPPAAPPAPTPPAAAASSAPEVGPLNFDLTDIPEAGPQPPVPEAQPLPVPEAQPLPVPEAQPLPVPEAQPLPVPEAQPLPVPEAQPLPVPEAQPLPVPEAQPLPVPEAQPLPVPEAQPLDISASSDEDIQELDTSELEASEVEATKPPPPPARAKPTVPSSAALLAAPAKPSVLVEDALQAQVVVGPPVEAPNAGGVSLEFVPAHELPDQPVAPERPASATAHHSEPITTAQLPAATRPVLPDDELMLPGRPAWFWPLLAVLAVLCIGGVILLIRGAPKNKGGAQATHDQGVAHQPSSTPDAKPARRDAGTTATMTPRDAGSATTAKLDAAKPRPDLGQPDLGKPDVGRPKRAPDAGKAKAERPKPRPKVRRRPRRRPRRKRRRRRKTRKTRKETINPFAE